MVVLLRALIGDVRRAAIRCSSAMRSDHERLKKFLSSIGDIEAPQSNERASLFARLARSSSGLSDLRATATSGRERGRHAAGRGRWL
jgi:hypothetical protein